MPFEDKIITKFVADPSNLIDAFKQIEKAANRAAGTTVGGSGGGSGGGGTRGATTQANTMAKAFKGVERSAQSASSMLRELQAQTGGTTSSFRNAAMSIQTGTGWLDKFSIQADRASMMMWKFTMAGISVRELGVIAGATGVGFGLMTKKIIDSFTVIDRIKRQFTAIYDSAAMGNNAVDYLAKQAPKIRYSIKEVLESGRLLALEGFAPKDLIYDMADLAAGVNQEGITIVNASRAFVDATNGQFRRLKETFQVTREDAMKFAPDAFGGPNGQITNQAKATEAIIMAIRTKYRGMNEATMQTIQGQLSNVDDVIIRALAPLGKKLEPTLMSWFEKFFGFAEKTQKFFEGPFGAVIAQTMLWGTVILGTVSALSLLGAAMLSLFGIFAAYKVFVETRTKDMTNVIMAEMELMAITRDMAAIEAQRSMADLNYLRAKVALMKAVQKEEVARIALLSPGGDTPAGRAALAAASGDVATAGAGVAAFTIPKKIIEIENKIVASKAEEAAIQTNINALASAGLNVDERALHIEGLRLAKQKEYTEELVVQRSIRSQELFDARRSSGASVASAGAGLNIPKASRLAGMGQGFASIFDTFMRPIRATAGGLSKIISGIFTFGEALLFVGGALSALALLIGPIIATYAVLKYSGDVQKRFTQTIEQSIKSLSTWDSLLQRSSTTQPVVEGMSADIDSLLKIKRGVFTTNLLQGLMAQEGMTFENARNIIGKVAEQQALNRGETRGRAASVRATVSTMSENQLRSTGTRTKITNSELNMAMQGMTSEMEAADMLLTKQGAQLDRNATKWIDAQIASGKLTKEEQKQYEELKASEHPALAISKMLNKQFEDTKNLVPVIKDVGGAIEAGVEAGKTDEEVKSELVDDYAAANESLKEMQQISQYLYDIDVNGRKEREDEIADLKLKVSLLQNVRQTYDAILTLMTNAKSADILGGTGVGFQGAIFGGANSAAAATAAAGSKGKKKDEYNKQAWEWAGKNIEDNAALSLSEWENLPPNASASDKANAAFNRSNIYSNQAEETRKLQREALASTSGMTEEQKATANRVIDVNYAKTFNKSIEESIKGNKILSDDAIAGLEAAKKTAAAKKLGAAAEWELDKQILDIKEKQAQREGDMAAVNAIAAEREEKLIAAREKWMSDAESYGSAELDYLKKAAEQGLIDDSQVDTTKQKMIGLFKWIANQYPKNSLEWYQNMSKALDLMGDETEDKWDGIIGKIIGAPESMLREVMSESYIAKRFGSMEDALGLSKSTQAGILSQSGNTLTIKVDFEGALQTMDRKLQAALPNAINSFGRDLVSALNS